MIMILNFQNSLSIWKLPMKTVIFILVFPFLAYLININVYQLLFQDTLIIKLVIKKIFFIQYMIILKYEDFTLKTLQIYQFIIRFMFIFIPSIVKIIILKMKKLNIHLLTIMTDRMKLFLNMAKILL